MFTCQVFTSFPLESGNSGGNKVLYGRICQYHWLPILLSLDRKMHNIRVSITVNVAQNLFLTSFNETSFAGSFQSAPKVLAGKLACFAWTNTKREEFDLRFALKYWRSHAKSLRIILLWSTKLFHMNVQKKYSTLSSTSFFFLGKTEWTNFYLLSEQSPK